MAAACQQGERMNKGMSKWRDKFMQIRFFGLFDLCSNAYFDHKVSS